MTPGFWKLVISVKRRVSVVDPSETVTWKLDTDDVPGVPVTVPSDSSVKPFGTPCGADHVLAGPPPVATIGCVYGVPTVAGGRICDSLIVSVVTCSENVLLT